MPCPENHNLRDAVSYHLRAGDSRSERAVAEGFVKAVTLDGAAVEIEIQSRENEYAVQFNADRPVSSQTITEIAVRLLGIAPSPAAFVSRFETDILLGPLARKRPGLIIPQLATPFEALAWAITGQQISFAAAHRLRRSLIEFIGKTTPGGMLAFPDATAVAAVGQEALRSCGYSRNKARALAELAEDISSGQLILPVTLGKDVELWRARLRERFGFGPWTVEYAFLRGWGYPDSDLSGDAVVRRALVQVAPRYGGPRRRSLSAYRPWRSFAACHLWAEMA
ncbi:DNA-3-methyladenine glycosylase family protein [Verrucomicrobiota bacterium sgz303538]